MGRVSASPDAVGRFPAVLGQPVSWRGNRLPLKLLEHPGVSRQHISSCSTRKKCFPPRCLLTGKAARGELGACGGWCCAQDVPRQRHSGSGCWMPSWSPLKMTRCWVTASHSSSEPHPSVLQAWGSSPWLRRSKCCPTLWLRLRLESGMVLPTVTAAGTRLLFCFSILLSPR